MKITKNNAGDIAYLPQGSQLYEFLEDKDGGRHILTKKKTKKPNKYIILDVLHYARDSYYVKLFGGNEVHYSSTEQTFLMER